MELYRLKGGVADSMGTKVDTPGATLAERPGAVTIVRVMNEDYGVNMIHNVRTQIAEDVAVGYDKIIVMAEMETVPDWLLHDERAVFWAVDDPKGQDIATTRRIVGEIKRRIDQLIA